MKPFKLALALSLPFALIAGAGSASAADWQHQRGPAAHQAGYDNGGYNNGRYHNALANQLRQDIRQLDNRIDRANANRRISNREAAGLRRNVNEIQRLYASYARNGLNNAEVRAIQNRINAVERSIGREARDFDNRRR